MIENLKDIIEDAADAAIQIRRTLHRRPELGREEFETAQIIAEVLESLGIWALRPSAELPTAICGNICCRTGGDTGGGRRSVGLRADIDALPIREAAQVEFASSKAGFMHACGHDVHMAVILGVAMVITKIKKLINIDVKLIFQPDEEGAGGAKILIKDGVLENFTDGQGSPENKSQQKKALDLILGLHVKPELSAGTIGLKYGKVHAASAMFKIHVIGENAHGAKPHMGRDALVAAACIVTNAQAIASRSMNPMQGGLVTFGRIYGGEAANIIANRVVLKGILRGEDEETCDMLKNRLADVVRGTAQAMGVQTELVFQEGYPALINDDSAVNMARGAIKNYNNSYGVGNQIRLREIEEATMTVDDFAYYLKEIPGAYLFLGSGYEGRENPGLHTDTFDVNEECIQTGIAALVSILIHLAHLPENC